MQQILFARQDTTDILSAAGLGSRHPWPWRVFASGYLFLVFLTFVLLTADIIAIHIVGMTVRAVLACLGLMLTIQALSLRERLVVDRTLGTLFLFFCFSVSFSFAQTVAPLHSVGYTAWVYVTLLAVITPLYNQALWGNPEDSFGIWMLVFRILGLMIPIEAAFFQSGPDLRPHLFFYEPSYAALFFTMYFTASLYLALDFHRKYWRDVALSLIVIATLSSATAILGLLLSLGLVILFSQRKALLFLCIVPLFIVAGVTAYLSLKDTPTGYLMFGFLEAGIDDPAALLQGIFARSGNRGLLVLMGVDVFQQHPITGIGIGSGATWNTVVPPPDYIRPYLSDVIGIKDNPFTSIPIELLAETGLLGFTGFALIILYIVHRTRRLGRPTTADGLFAKAALIAFLAGGLTLCGSSNFLRFYWWGAAAVGLGLATRYETLSPATPRS
jgi:hypothetical protein